MFRRTIWAATALAALALVLALGGCASDDVGPSKAELKARWDGENIYPQAYKRDLLAFLRTYLNEPSGVRGASVSAPVLKDVGPGERYYICVRYNERKSTGGYAGPKDGVAVYVSGKLDRFFDQPREVQPFCKDVAFAPFPELEALTR
jgi:hypothetical protein